MAGVLIPPTPVATTRDAASALIGMRRTLARNSPGGSGTVVAFRIIGLGLAVATLLCGLIRFEDPSRSVDLVAALMLGWLIGWVMGPILVRGAGLGLRPEWFALVPIPPRRLATGLLGPPSPGWRRRSLLSPSRSCPSPRPSSACCRPWWRFRRRCSSW
jgi:hypothetical protein